MEQKLIVSVIIPMYNAEKYIAECLDSVLSQNSFEFEVIVVDDGSADRSPEICDAYKQKDSRVKVIHKKNGGVSLARQDGVSIASGEFVAFIDADDRITEDFMETILSHTDVDIIRFGCIVEHPVGRREYRKPKEREGFYNKHDIETEIFPYLIQYKTATYYCPSLWCHVFKRKLFIDNMVKDRVIKIGEDGACVIPCMYHAQSFFCIHKCLYVYNYNENSATKGKKAFPWDGPMMIAEHLRSRIDMSMFDFQQQLDRKVVHELFSVIVSQFNRDEKYGYIGKEIIKKLCVTEYEASIKKARFSGSVIARFMHYVLKNKMILILYFYNRCKRLRR